jgi:hypothetical protein
MPFIVKVLRIVLEKIGAEKKACGGFIQKIQVV